MPAEPDRYARFQRGRAHEFADLVPAEFRPKPESDDDPVTRVIVYIEREHSGGMEYDFVNPSDVKLSPGLGMVAPHRAGARLSLSFTAGPRPQDTRIWTRWNTSRNLVLSALSDLADTFGYRLQPKPGLRSGPEAAVRAKPEEPPRDRPAASLIGTTFLGTISDGTGGDDEVLQRGDPGTDSPAPEAVPAAADGGGGDGEPAGGTGEPAAEGTGADADLRRER